MLVVRCSSVCLRSIPSGWREKNNNLIELLTVALMFCLVFMEFGGKIKNKLQGFFDHVNFVSENEHVLFDL